MRLIALILFSAGCISPTAVSDAPAPVDRPSVAETQLRALIGENPRRGDLVITDRSLQLRIRRGERSMPFLSVPRGTFQLACDITATTSGATEQADDAWWIFTGGEDAVALQLTTRSAVVWFWDDARGCPVTMQPIDTESGTPDRYYKAEDAQVAYRWNHRTTPLGVLKAREEDVDGITSGGDRDFLPDVPGTELLIVEPDFIAIRSAAGETLLQKQLEIDPDWPCYRAELTVFGEVDGGFYAIATFETFGTFNDCDALAGDTRFASEFFDWDKSAGQFVPTLRSLDTRRPLNPGGEDTVAEVTRYIDVDGGRLRMERRSAKRYEAGDAGHCWRWSSSTDRVASFDLIGSDGATVSLGAARSGAHERGEDCGVP